MHNLVSRSALKHFQKTAFFFSSLRLNNSYISGGVYIELKSAYTLVGQIGVYF